MAGKRFQRARKSRRGVACRHHHDMREVTVAICGMQFPAITVAGHMLHAAAFVFDDTRLQQGSDLGGDIGAEDTALRIGLPVR
ncbi:hypothetical protein D3C71_1929600 [compost metagenome]